LPPEHTMSDDDLRASSSSIASADDYVLSDDDMGDDVEMAYA